MKLLPLLSFGSEEDEFRGGKCTFCKQRRTIYIIIILSLIALYNHNEDDPKRASYIQYGCSKCGTQHQCFPKYLRMGTARMKLDIVTEEESEKIKVNTQRSKAGTKDICPNGLAIARAYRWPEPQHKPRDGIHRISECTT